MKKPYLLSVVILLSALLLSSCIVIPAVQQSAPPAATAAPATAQPTALPTAIPQPSDTPLPPKIDFTPINNNVAQKLAQVVVGSPIADAQSILGEPKKILGKGTYQYKVIAGGADAAAASVYRFEIDKIPLELIVRDSDGIVLKKQISTPDLLTKLVDNANIPLSDNTAYADALKAFGANPFNWMEFLAPNAEKGDRAYQVAVWPDANGQYAAVVKDGIVLRGEYQPDKIVLGAAAADGKTPRVPRFLKPLPGTANAKVTAFPLFAKFAALKMNAPESAVTAAFGPPTAEDTSNPSVRLLMYSIANASFSGENVVFAFSLTTGDAKVLIAKNITIMPKVETDLRARYASQILTGMTKPDVEKFLGKGFASNQSVNEDGNVIESVSWAADKAMVNALFAQGDAAVIGSSFALYDTEQEAATLYEEYVLIPLKPGTAVTPKATPRPSLKPSLLPSISLEPRVTPTPTLSLRLPSFIVITPAPTPTPTPVPSSTLRLPSFSLVTPKLTRRLPTYTLPPETIY